MTLSHMQTISSKPVASIVQDGLGTCLRRVSPYLYSFDTTVKGRWMNRTVLEVVTSEFSRLGDQAVVTRMIREGHVRVSSNLVAPDYRLRGHDRLQTTVVRHDPDVLADPPVKVVHESSEVVVVDKPPSVPIHANARYVHNTLMSMLEEQDPVKYSDIRVIHRLDALTQGLVVLAKTSRAAARFCAALREGDAHKMYYARVVGHVARDTIQIADTLSHTLPSRQHKPEQLAQTTIRVLWRGHLGNGHYPLSLVQCHPQTGRMHQLRRHLAQIGHPIINDPLYNDTKEAAHVYWPYSRVAKGAIGQASMWPPFAEQEIKVPEPDVEATRVMGIDLCAAEYAFPAMGMRFEVERPGWVVNPAGK